MQVGVLINPISGRGGRARDAGTRRAELVRTVAARFRVDTDVRITERGGHAADLTNLFLDAGCDRVIAWGGDGTVNEAAGPIIKRPGSAVLGIVPGGSGDGLARSLGLFPPPERALEVALTAAGAPVDVGYLGDRHFLNIAGIGFDATVGMAFNRRGKRGMRGYVRQLFTTIWTYSPGKYGLRVDEAVTEGARFLIAFANGREYGNNMVLAPDADPCDGWLDVVTVEGGGPIRQLWRARRLAFRPGRPAKGIAWGRCRTATITGERLVCHVDGETFVTTGTVDARIEPGAILVAGAKVSAG
jgi:YegS/Rv2252/BmrU family lipid kinase